MIAAAGRRVALTPALLCAGLASAVALRVAVAGGAGARSAPAGVVFGAALLLLAVAAGWRPGRPAARASGLGVAGGLALLAVPLALRFGLAALPIRLGAAGGSFALWASVVTLVAVAEEVVLRGALMGALLRGGRVSPEVAVGIAAVAFALLHVPVYGWVAFPLDLAVGVWLGGLRLAGGGVAAPATAHTLADLAVWWLR